MMRLTAEKQEKEKVKADGRAGDKSTRNPQVFSVAGAPRDGSMHASAPVLPPTASRPSELRSIWAASACAATTPRRPPTFADLEAEEGRKGRKRGAEEQGENIDR